MSVRLILALVASVSVVACGSSTTAPSSTNNTTGNTGTSVSIVNGASTLTTTAYAPNPVTVPVGTTIRWMNNDNVAHTSTANDSSWDSGSIPPGGSFNRTFMSAGSFGYKCTIHPNMVGTVTVQ
jgi:plastocyanin